MLCIGGSFTRKVDAGCRSAAAKKTLRNGEVLGICTKKVTLAVILDYLPR